MAGIELPSVGELAPANLSQTGRRELRHLLRSQDLHLAALACPLRRGLDEADGQEARLDYVKQTMILSHDLGPRQVVVQAGRMPKTDDEPRAPILREALTLLGRHGDRVGVQLLLEVGTEPPDVLTTYLARFDTGSLGICFNPGNLLRQGQDPIAFLRTAATCLRYVHATDARQVNPGSAQAVPLGHGDIDWLALLGGLEEIGYRDWLTISEVRGLAESAAAAAFLQRILRNEK